MASGDRYTVKRIEKTGYGNQSRLLVSLRKPGRPEPETIDYITNKDGKGLWAYYGGSEGKYTEVEDPEKFSVEGKTKDDVKQFFNKYFKEYAEGKHRTSKTTLSDPGKGPGPEGLNVVEEDDDGGRGNRGKKAGSTDTSGEGHWITVGGKKVFIPEGKTKGKIF